MSEYKLNSPKQAEAMVDVYHKVDGTVVDGYKAIERKFVGAFLEKMDNEGKNGKTPASEE